MRQPRTTFSNVRIRPLEVGILALAGAAAFLPLSFALSSQAPTHFPFPGLSILNAAGYLVLILLLYLPTLYPFQRGLRWLLLPYTAVTILGWVVIGSHNMVGYLDKAMERAHSSGVARRAASGTAANMTGAPTSC
jgi:hypothetical protein